MCGRGLQAEDSWLCTCPLPTSCGTAPFPSPQLPNSSLSAMQIPLRALRSSFLARGEQQGISLLTCLSVTPGQGRERGGEKPQSHVCSLLFFHRLDEGEGERVTALLLGSVLGQRLRVRRKVAGAAELTWTLGQTLLLYRLLYRGESSFG